MNSFQVEDIQSTPLSCVDGRHPQPGLFTPGGDAGELVMALVIHERNLGRPMTKLEVKAAIQSYLKTMTQPHLTFCLDDSAQNFLMTAAGYQTLNITRPVDTRRATILQYVVQAQAQGDLFF